MDGRSFWQGAARALRRLAVIGFAYLGACVGPFEPCGTDEGAFAIQVEVTDARSSGPPSSQALLIVVDGTFADTVLGPEPGTVSRVFIAAAPERPGTYDVTVAAPGYERWARLGIAVRRGKCDQVETARLSAALQPAL